jgi:tetratricopeptide (TPR) repeat protein
MVKSFRSITLKKTLSSPQIQHIPAWFQQALALHQQGQIVQAQSLYQQILRLEPQHFDSLHLLGVSELQTGDHEQGIRHIRQAIQIKPNIAAAHNNLGNALNDLQQPEQALACYDRALALDPGYAEAHNHRGNVLRQLKQPEQALACYDRALALRPDYPEAHNNRGNALSDLQRLDEALLSYQRALTLRPTYAEACNNRGVALRDLGRLEQALQSYQQALTLRPDYADAQNNTALALLLSGNFAAGWPWYEARLSAAARQCFNQPQWDGSQPVHGKTVLLHCEQGLGDSIQFCRYAPLLAERGARVLLEIQAPLAGLLGDLPGIAQLIVAGEKRPEFDLHCPLPSLPRAFSTTLASIPLAAAYLSSQQHKVEEWEGRLGAKTRLRVGLVWSGGTEYRNDHWRSLALSQLLPYLPRSCDYICLQKELRERDCETLQAQSNIRFFGAELHDFSDTAALCEQMDLIISTDTSVAHLAGALGKKTWVLLSYMPDWRWQLQRQDCVWYPEVLLYRQTSLGDWNSVLAKVSADLSGLSQQTGDQHP